MEPETQLGRRRFTRAALVGSAFAVIPFLWLLWDGSIEPLRTALPGRTFSNFYDLQARSLFHGNWAIPKGNLGIEAFVVHGREYMYFGPFPSLLRMPILAFTHSLDGKLTALSMLLAWLVTALLSSLLLWRIRILVRGSAAVSRAEAVAVSVLIATILSGSVMLYLGSLPWVYHEAFSWSIALGIGAFFALLGVLERPSARRIVAMSALIVGAGLSRTTVGWGCIISVVIAAGWFALGRLGDSNRRWWRPMLIAGLVPLAVGCAVNWAKFRSLFGLPSGAQVYSTLNAHRRAVLATNGDSLFHPRFLPSTLWAYLRPTGLRFTALYPFITLPAIPARGVAGAVLDQSYRTASLPASTPLLCALAVCGLIAAFRRREGRNSRLIAIAIIGAGAITSGVLIQAYISERYQAEFLPFLIVAGSLGLVEVWRRLDSAGRQTRRVALGVIVALGGFSIVANFAISRAPTDPYSWGVDRVHAYVSTQQDLADLTGRPARAVPHGNQLPAWAPADRLFALGNCDSLYISTGEYEGPWIPVEFRLPNVSLTFRRRLPTHTIPVVTVGNPGGPMTTLSVEGGTDGRVRFRVNLKHRQPSKWLQVDLNHPYRLSLFNDTSARPLFPVPGQHFYDVYLDGSGVFNWWSQAFGAVTPNSRATGPNAFPFTVAEAPPTPAKLCQSLTRLSQSSR